MNWSCPPERVEIDAFILRLTSSAAPEQYDAFRGDEKVGYLRVRHGRFTVECPAVGGELVLNLSTEGEGQFEAQERDGFLRRAIDAIESWRQRAGDVDV